MGVGALNIVLGSYSFLLSVFYIPQFFHGATNTRWGLLAVTTPILLLALKPLGKFTLLHLIGLTFLVLSFLSLIWTFNFYDSIDKLISFLIVAQLFVLGTRLDHINLKWIFIGLALGLAVSLVNWPKGLFVNENILAETAILTLVGLIVFEGYIFTLFVIPNIVTGSRAVIVAGLVTMAIFVWNKHRIAGYSLIALSVLFIGASYIFGFNVNSFKERLDIWQDALNGISLFGNGIGSFHSLFPWFSENIDVFKTRPVYAHNDLLQITFELGLFGLALSVLFMSILLRTNSNEKYIISTFAVLSLFSFPFHMPTSVFIFAIVAGYMSRNWNSVFNFNDVCGISCLERI
jgi:hypothetical protein